MGVSLIGLLHEKRGEYSISFLVYHAKSAKMCMNRSSGFTPGILPKCYHPLRKDGLLWIGFESFL